MNSNDPNDLIPLAPPPPPGPPVTAASLAQEEKAMRSGGGMLVGAFLFFALLVAGVIFAMMGGDEPYEQFGQNLNGLKTNHFDAFWACAFQGPVNVSNNQELQEQLHLRGSRGKGRYGNHVRDECVDKLSDLEPALAALIPPAEQQEKVNELIGATRALRGAWSDYISHLSALGDEAYDEDAASDPMTRIARAWYDYKRVHGQLNTSIREQLGQ